MELSGKPRCILEGIAEGPSFEEILRESRHYDNIEAAAEALKCIDQGETGKACSLDAIRRKQACAYEHRSRKEGAQLLDMFQCGLGVADIV